MRWPISPSHIHVSEVSSSDNTVQLQAFGGQWLGLSAEDSASALQATAATASGWETFEVREVPFWYGVNLGSLFVPENWMAPGVYDGTNATDTGASMGNFTRHEFHDANGTDVDGHHEPTDSGASCDDDDFVSHFTRLI